EGRVASGPCPLAASGNGCRRPRHCWIGSRGRPRGAPSRAAGRAGSRRAPGRARRRQSGARPARSGSRCDADRCPLRAGAWRRPASTRGRRRRPSLRPARLRADGTRHRDRLAVRFQERTPLAAPPRLATEGRLRRRLGYQGPVGALPLPAPAAARRRVPPDGRASLPRRARRAATELDHQVRPDGCAHEASTAYHRLVTELFLCAVQAADVLAPARIPDSFRERLDRMLAFVRGCTRPDGLAPQIGDADDGRFLPLGDYGADPRDHRHLLAQAGVKYERATGSAAYPDGGYYVLRAGGLYAIVRCGDTGRRGRGGHGHNDQLSFELAAGSEPLVVDPGTYLYTADPLERNRFRSTAFHSTLRV